MLGWSLYCASKTVLAKVSFCILFKNGKYYRSLQFYPESNVYHVSINEGSVKEDLMDMKHV